MIMKKTNMIDLSICICTIRDPELFLKPTLDEIARADKKNYKYEILVYGPISTFIAHPENPTYIQEVFNHGNVYGYNFLGQLARGRNIAFLTDDMVVPKNLFDIVDFLDNNNEKFNIAGFQMHDGQDYSPFPNRLILQNLGWHNCINEILESVSSRYGYNYSRSPIPFIRFIACSKETLDIMLRGYLFHPAFRNGGGDQYLSIWAWYHGQKLWEKLPCKLYKRDECPSVLEYLERDGETLRDLVLRLALGYTTYV